MSEELWKATTLNHLVDLYLAGLIDYCKLLEIKNLLIERKIINAEEMV